MVKLQLLLRHPCAEPELAAALRAALETLGMQIDGVGRATLTAHMAEADFARLFSQPPRASADLPVPAALNDAIRLITIAPRHVATTLQHRAHHAAI